MNSGRFSSHFSLGTRCAAFTVLMVLFSFNAYGLEIVTEKFVCPADGTDFEYDIAISGTVTEKRLDLKLVGYIISPWPVPQCPTCGFVL